MAAIPEAVLAYRVDELERDSKAQRDEIKALKATIARMELEAADRERARLKAGIGALGSVILALFGILWSYRSVIFK